MKGGRAFGPQPAAAQRAARPRLLGGVLGLLRLNTLKLGLALLGTCGLHAAAQAAQPAPLPPPSAPLSSPFQPTSPLQPTNPTQPSSPAQQVFEEVNEVMQNEYGGLSTVSRADLMREYQARLQRVCQAATASAPCPASKAYPVLSAEVAALHDEHSFLQDPDEFRDFVTEATGGSRQQFGLRLGLYLGQNRLVLDVLPGSASALAGLKRGDVLQTLNAQPFRYEALKAAREQGQTIALGVQRRGQSLKVSLTPRQSSTRDLPSLTWLEGHAQAGRKQVALLRIPTFLGGGVAQAVHDLVHQAQERGAAGLLVDLRGNAGGDLSECDAAASAFVSAFTRLSRSAQGTLRLQVKAGSRLEDDLMLSSLHHPALWQGPLAVLVDAASASCSEFFAYEVQYAQQEQGQQPQALIVGEPTAGVGNTATRVFPLTGGAALQLTIQNYLKPDGQPYPQQVRPDVAATTDPFMLSQGVDSMVQAALRALGL